MQGSRSRSVSSHGSDEEIQTVRLGSATGSARTACHHHAQNRERDSEVTLQGGPLHGTEIEDLGTAHQHFDVYRDRKAPGVEVGVAIYEPDLTRDNSFYLTTIWDGACSLKKSPPETKSQ